MPVELRKRKAAPPLPPPPPKKAKRGARTTSKAKEKPAEAAASTNGSAKAPAVGDVITLDGFGGEIETNDGAKTTLKALVDESKAGVVLFTYPKASTPGCTRQACLFRDAYDALTSASGLAIYGLSADSPKANTTFREKQKLPYPLLCDPHAAGLIGALGLKKTPPGKGTVRGVFAVDKEGKVLAAQAGSPEGTVAVVRKLVERLSGGSAGGAAQEVEEKVAGAQAEEKAREEAPTEAATEAGEEKKPADVPVAAPTNGEAKAEEGKAEEEKTEE